MILPPKELITYDDDQVDDDDYQFFLQIYDSKLECQGCEYRGSYYIEGSECTDSGKIGVCFDCLNNDLCEIEILK